MTGVRTLRALIRGGNWNNSVNAGGWAVNGNNSPRNTNTNIGFRCCSKSPCMCQGKCKHLADVHRSRLVHQPLERLGPTPCPQAGPKITARRELVTRCANAPVEHSFMGRFA